ncbi:hypothetical protein EZV62_022557 [Acer yangbiense]|uniref:Uncharacterized protein n=1 Tax=Acer yangbiense TaxID=1000413 RepID=A0A5C7H8M8_9ROSI|nr:hypothetical protein EZV62_022557 [Acer yangbiense]
MKEAKFNSPGLGFFTFYWLILVVLLNGNRYLEHLSGLVLKPVVTTLRQVVNFDLLVLLVHFDELVNYTMVCCWIEDLTGDTSGLGPFELEAFQDYEYKFMTKYVKVGSIKKEEVLVADSESIAKENEGKCSYSV